MKEGIIILFNTWVYMICFFLLIWCSTLTSTFYSQGVYHGAAFVVGAEWVYYCIIKIPKYVYKTWNKEMV